MPPHPFVGLYFQDLALGEEWISPARTVTQAEISAFAGLSGDFNALHMDHVSAADGPFGEPVAHGLLGLSIASGLGSHAPRVETMAFLGIVRWDFLKPIRIGATIRVATRVESLEPKARGRRGLVTWHRRLLDQTDQVLQEGLTLTMVRGRPNEPGADS